ncbi:hypothetical protein [Actinomadura sp. BRA 177]|uniref:hypothetical protein n=1 Tax=Actinomadura sp. BRA 177 TaxID=2745202 RepID=UPI0028157DE6|nr:hypothetical protein [Actinomadura sp. BRA 177]
MTGEELDTDARVELRTLPKELAAKVARHLVMAGRLAEDEPEQSYKHARAARRLASRVGIVREAAGIAAYHVGEGAGALAGLRAARRLGAGDDSYLPVMADCERGLGRPERALDLIKSPEAEKLDPMGRVELRIVESGVRRDMGQYDAAVVTLQIPELRDRRLRPWSMRLFYAYADALVEAGREDEAGDWFARAAAADRDGETDAAERYAEIEGLHILDTEEEDVEMVGETAGETADVAGAPAAEGEDADDDTATGGRVSEGAAAEATVTEGPVTGGPVTDGAAVDSALSEGPADEAAAGEAAVTDSAADVAAAAEQVASEGAGGEDAAAEAATTDGVIGEGAAGEGVATDGVTDVAASAEGSVGEGATDVAADAEGAAGEAAASDHAADVAEAGEGAAAEGEGAASDRAADVAAAGEGAAGEGVAGEDGGGEGGVPEAAATDIAFRAAEPEVREVSDEDVPEAPVVFLEPKAEGEERRPAGD